MYVHYATCWFPLTAFNLFSMQLDCYYDLNLYVT